MSSDQAISWKRISAEGAAIVISIILAFAIDAWWDELKERRDETEILNRLRVEFLRNIERTERPAEMRKLAYAAELFELIEAGRDRGETTIDVPTLMLMHLAEASTFEADTPVMDGLIRSGRIEIINDQQVLAAIASWERALRNYTEVANRERWNTDNRFLPALFRTGDVAHVLMRFDGPNALSATPDPLDITSIRIDDQFKAVVAERNENARRSRLILEEARQAAADAVRLIEIAMAK